MKGYYYEHDKATVDAWLLNGGAEIVLEVIRRKGWTVEVVPVDEWEFLPDVVVAADRVHGEISVNGAASPYHQAMFAAAVVEGIDAVPDEPESFSAGWKRWKYPLFCEHDKFLKCSTSRCTSFCDKIRLSSEATISLIGKAATT